MDSLRNLPPGTIMMLGALLLPFLAKLGNKLPAIGALVLSVVSLLLFWFTPDGSYGNVEFFGNTLNMVRIDSLSRIFGVIFHLAAIMASIYALHLEDTKQHIAAMIYAGGAIAAACAGDLVTLFVFWELTAVSSVVLVWAGEGKGAYKSGMRYLIIQVISGVLLLSGAILEYSQDGSLMFEAFGDGGSLWDLSPGAQLILLAFGIKAAFPLLHNWLQDAYPQASVTGTVFLSAFTTKLAIYALARGFAGTDELIYIGCAMTLFPIVFAVIENDLRRVLAYSLNNQLGFMVVGIGIGTELAINGAAAHAFCHIIYKALLFMSMGAVLYRVGTTKATELGGLHKSMPWTTGFCLIGAGSISGFPLLSGFVSKSMIITAAGEEHMFWVWIVLLIASAGVMEHSGIKIPFFAFFAHDSGKRVKEAPLNMLIAMGMAAALCIGAGVFYWYLYDLLPSEPVTHHVDHEGHSHAEPYKPYTAPHVVMQLQLLMFAVLAFVFLMQTKLYPAEKRSTNLDTDWIYRRFIPTGLEGIGKVYHKLDAAWRSLAVAGIGGAIATMGKFFNERGVFGRPWATSTMAFWAAVLLGGFLLIYFT
ncbi:Na(+)/H(+) antiporter subunit D [Mariniblastus fucicola]|uniref:Na(+)/H(+) antiporter subunit D n=1 Tax=Mariniblastus fucicola TaxID=980251 RepID=A0A5B9PHT0_9BACT|nr:Na(+)/H(+) antiporter subunit D [Mariniblastus fucicola]QEG24232.1 Na(+)/H(+) antiporter subunit D [Mariniblastus fucicola]